MKTLRSFFAPFPLLVLLTLLAEKSVCRADEEFFLTSKEKMINEHLIARGIRDERVIAAMNKIDREAFVPEHLKMSAYSDGPLPIGHGQTISQPYIVAFMTELLEVKPTDKVLEIGTGSGYQAAVLAEIAEEVYSIEIVEPLFIETQDRMARLGYEKVKLRLGNGWLGWPDEDGFDKIIITAAPDEIPAALVEQLREGGKMVVPVGKQHDIQNLIVGVKEGGNFKTVKTIPVRFVPLVEKAKTKDA